MALILRNAVKMYYYLNDEIADPRVQEWPLMRTPWPGLVIIAIYLGMVKKWLPKFMENRPAYDLRKVIALYNAIQIFCCMYVVYQSLRLGWLNNYSLLCHPVEYGPEDEEYAWKVCYVYFVIKIVDLFDTVFFVLRKKQNQVSFLHVYHHFGMSMVSWGVVKWQPGGHMSLLVPVNSVVHIVMYGYYLLTIWDDSYKKSLWWKKYVTQLQILQFTVMLLHLCVPVFAQECACPWPPAYVLIPQNLFMVALFCDFYYRTYIKSNKSTKTD